MRIVILTSCFVVCAIACAGTFALGNDDDPTIQARLDRTERELTTVKRNAEIAAAEIASVEATLRATRAIADQPDWSMLLALLSRSAGVDVVLKSYNVNVIEPPAAPAASPPAAAPAEANAKGRKPGAKPTNAPQRQRYSLLLDGTARSQFAVTQFVLRLEQSGVFDRVKLVDTSRQTFNDADAVGFRIECGMDTQQTSQSMMTTTAATGKETAQ